MGKKVSKQIVRNNMESIAAFLRDASRIGLVVDGEHRDMLAAAVGMQMMADYVQAVIDGEVAVENDMGHLCNTLLTAAAAELAGRELEDEDDEEGPSWIDQIVSRLAATNPEGGDGDAE